MNAEEIRRELESAFHTMLGSAAIDGSACTVNLEYLNANSRFQTALSQLVALASADTPRSGDAPVAWPGLSDLECAISQLRETGYYFDEEGEATNELAELLAALKCVAPPANAPTSPAGLHPRTADLVRRFSVAMAEKLFAAQEKYGYRDGWADPSWIDECREHLLQHVEKGDPRDVANYCAFLWHHGEDTKSALARVRARHNEILDRFVAGITQIGVALGAGEQQARDEFPDGLLQRVAKLKVDAPADARDAEDARRYRWLRHCNIEQDRSVHGPDYTELLDGERLDAAIDSAMGAGGWEVSADPRITEIPTGDVAWTHDRHAETWRHESLGELIEYAYPGIGVGSVVFVADKRHPSASNFMVDADHIIDEIACAASDDGGDYADDYVFGISDEAKSELETLLQAWSEKHLPAPTWWLCENVREYVITQSDIDSALGATGSES